MNRDRNLFWELVEPHHQKARAFCRKLMDDRDDGDDLYQDSLVSALSGFKNLREIKAFKPWLYRIIINSFKNRRRQPWWKRLVPLGSEARQVPEPGDPSARQAARHRLEIAFEAVSDSDRALVTLFELEGWSIAELAEVNGWSENNVKVRLHRARHKMRAALIRFFGNGARHETKLTIRSEEKVCVVSKPSKD